MYLCLLPQPLVFLLPQPLVFLLIPIRCQNPSAVADAAVLCTAPDSVTSLSGENKCLLPQPLVFLLISYIIQRFYLIHLIVITLIIYKHTLYKGKEGLLRYLQRPHPFLIYTFYICE